MVRLGSEVGVVACGLVDAGGSQGTAYLVSPKLAVTSGRVVQHLCLAEEGTRVLEQRAGRLTVNFGPHQTGARVARLDSVHDVAVLELSTPLDHVPPLQLARPDQIQALGSCEIGLPPEEPWHEPALVIDPAARNRLGKIRTTVRAPALAERMVRPGHALAGCPVLVDGRAAGHLTQAVRDPADLESSFAGLLEAIPLEDVLAALPPEALPHPGGPGGGEMVRPPESSEHKRLTAPPIGRKQFHAVLTYSAVEENRRNDQDWVNALLDRLGGWGFHCFPAPQVAYGDPQFAHSHAKQLGRTSVALVALSERWARGSTGRETVRLLAQRAEREEPFRIIVLRLDDTPLPPPLADIGVEGVLDLRTLRAEYSRTPLPSWEASLLVARLLAGETVDGLGTTGPTGNGTAPDPARHPELRPGGAPPPSGDAVPALASVSQAADEVVAQLRAAAKNPQLVRTLAVRWLDGGFPGSDVPVEAARLLVSREQFDLALEVLDRAEAQGLTDQSARARIRLLRMRGAALGEAGRHDEAIAVLEDLRGRAPLDEWAAGLLGSNYKQKWVKLGRRRRALLLKAYEVYAEAFEYTLSYYTGINAATLARTLGREDDALALAAVIRDRLKGPDVDYLWEVATLGEANLLLGDLEEALEYYEQAAVQVMDRPREAVSIRQQFPLLLPEPLSEEERALRDTLDALYELGRGAAFWGYRVDSGGPEPSRFPERRVRLVRRRIQEALDRNDVSWGVCSAADGGDLLFAEALLARGGAVEVVLPWPAPGFRERRVAPAWQSRFDQLMERAQDRNDPLVQLHVLRPTEPGPNQVGKALLACADHIVDRALERADVRGEHPLLLCQLEADDNDSVSAFIAAAGVDEGLLVERIDLALVEGDAPAAAPSGHEPGMAETRASRVLTRVNLGADSPIADSAPRAEATGEYRKKHLVVIGIDRYHNWNRLANARADAQEFAEVLTRDFGFELAASLFDDAGTARGIKAAIQEDLAGGPNDSRVVEDDLVVLFFAGHGWTEEKPSGSRAGYIVPVDARAEGRSDLITMSQVAEWTEFLRCRHLLVIFDSCFSGAASLGGGVGGRSGFARVVITAGSADQEVADGGDDFPGHGLFTGRLLHGLTASMEETGLHAPISVMGLADYVRRTVPVDAAKVNLIQTPSLGFLPLHGDGTVILKREDRDAE